MRRNSILAIILLIALLSLSVVGAGLFDFETSDISKNKNSNFNNAIIMGDIISADIDMSNFNNGPSNNYGSISSVQYTVNAEIDISDMSELEKESLKKAVDNENTSLIINMTYEYGTIRQESFDGIDSIYIKDNTLYIEDEGYLSLQGSTPSLKITHIGLNNTGDIFITK